LKASKAMEEGKPLLPKSQRGPAGID